MAKKDKRKTVHRSSITGRFVREQDAKRNPKKSEKQQVRIKN